MTELPGNRRNRDGTADLLKGFAVLFMIQVHIMEQFASHDTYNSMFGELSLFLGGPPCAPVFLAVMGYFLAQSAKPPTYFLKRGAILFIGGILLNTARSVNLLFQIVLGEVDLDPWFFVLGTDIFTLAGLSLILTGCLSPLNSWTEFGKQIRSNFKAYDKEQKKIYTGRTVKHYSGGTTGREIPDLPQIQHLSIVVRSLAA
jgi:hypothetical protein